MMPIITIITESGVRSGMMRVAIMMRVVLCTVRMIAEAFHQEWFTMSAMMLWAGGQPILIKRLIRSTGPWIAGDSDGRK